MIWVQLIQVPARIKVWAPTSMQCLYDLTGRMHQRELPVVRWMIIS